MDINRNNYELYAIDFIEGNLSPIDAAEFLAFLANYPDIAREVDILRDQAVYVSEEQTSVNFAHLKKNLNSLPINNENFDEMCIAYHEGDLDTNTQQKLSELIQLNKTLKSRFDSYGQLKLMPNTSVIYPNKGLLKHEGKRVIFLPRLIQITAVAATIAALFLIFRNSPQEQVMLSVVEKDTAQKVLKTITPPNTEIINSDNIANKKITNKVNLVSYRKQEETDFIKKELLAAIDTNKPEEEQFIIIARIEPRAIPKQLSEAKIVVQKKIKKQTPIHTQAVVAEVRQKSNMLLTKATALTVTDIIKGGINGINKLVETELEYNATTDVNGKVTEFALSSESFNIQRKTRRN